MMMNTMLLTLFMLGWAVVVHGTKKNLRLRQCISQADVNDAQETWGRRIVNIGAAANSTQSLLKARRLVGQLYAYDEGKTPNTLFRPAKATPPNSFRLTECGALSYFVGDEVLQKECGIAGDTGFSLQPWSKVTFANAGCGFYGCLAYCMGNYTFVDASTGSETMADYSFVYENVRGQSPTSGKDVVIR
jgi:hypothetical protein